MVGGAGMKGVVCCVGVTSWVWVFGLGGWGFWVLAAGCGGGVGLFVVGFLFGDNGLIVIDGPAATFGRHGSTPRRGRSAIRSTSR